MASVPGRVQDVPLGQVEASQSLIGQGMLLVGAGAGAGVAIGLSVSICGWAPWWAFAASAVIGAGLGLAFGGAWVVADHRKNVRKLVKAIESVVGQDIDGDGFVAKGNADMSAEEKDKRDFGTFIYWIWPPEGKIARGTSSRQWVGKPLDTWGTMSQGQWTDYCERLVQESLICKTSTAENSPYRVLATREQALKRLAGQIILPDY